MASGRTSRRKGRVWQAGLAKRWRDAGLYPEAHSTQGEQTRSGRGIGRTPPDIEGTPWWVEAKHQRRPSPIKALEQAEREAKEAGDLRAAIAVVRPHGGGPDDAVVVMRLGEWEMLERLRVLLERLRRACDVPAGDPEDSEAAE